MLTLLHLEESATSGNLGVECFPLSFDVSAELQISSSYINSPSSVQDSHRTFQKSIETFNSSCILLYEGSLAFHSSQDALRNSSSAIHCEGYNLECGGRLGAYSSAIAAFKHWLLKRHVLYIQGFSSSVY